MKIKRLNVRKIGKIIVQVHKIIMTKIHPLKHLPVVHDWLNYRGKVVQLSNFIVPNHYRAADKFNVHGFFLFLVKLLFGLGRDIFHSRSINQSAYDRANVILRKKFHYLWLFLRLKSLFLFVRLLLVLNFLLFLYLGLLVWFMTLTGLDVFYFWK